MLTKLLNGYLHTDLYTKSTDAHAYLHYSSCHPIHCKNNIPYSQMLRLRRICSRDEDFRLRCEELSKYFLNRGYKKSVITKAVERVSLIPRAASLVYSKKNNNDRVPFIITHNPRNPPLRKILSEQHGVLLGDKRMNAAVPNIPLVGERNCKSLRTFSCRLSFPSNLIPLILVVTNVNKIVFYVGNISWSQRLFRVTTLVILFQSVIT